MKRMMLSTASTLLLATAIATGPATAFASGPAVYNVSSVAELKGTSMYINADAETRAELENFVTTAIKNPNAASNYTNSTYSLNVVKAQPAPVTVTPTLTADQQKTLDLIAAAKNGGEKVYTQPGSMGVIPASQMQHLVCKSGYGCVIEQGGTQWPTTFSSTSEIPAGWAVDTNGVILARPGLGDTAQNPFVTVDKLPGIEKGFFAAQNAILREKYPEMFTNPKQTITAADPKPVGATAKVGFGTIDSTGQIFDKRGTLVGSVSSSGELLNRDGKPMSASAKADLYKELNAVYTNNVVVDGKKLKDKEIVAALDTQVKNGRSQVAASEKAQKPTNVDTSNRTVDVALYGSVQDTKAVQTGTITLPADGKVSKLANGYSVDGAGQLYDQSGKIFARLEINPLTGTYQFVDVINRDPTSGVNTRFSLDRQKELFNLFASGAPITAQPITIGLPAAAEIKTLANGTTVDAEGILRNANGTTIGILNEKGQFLDPYTKKPVAAAQANEWVGLFNGKASGGTAECRAVSNVDNVKYIQKNAYISATDDGAIRE